MYLCLNLHGLAFTQLLKANDKTELYGVKSVCMNVPANKAKEKVIKRDLFQFMEPNNRIQWAHYIPVSGEEKKRKKVFIILEKMLTFQSWKQAVTETWKVKIFFMTEKKMGII